MEAMSRPSGVSVSATVTDPFFSDAVRIPDPGSTFFHVPENDVVAPANLLTDNFFAVVCATCTTEETVFTPHTSVVYSGTDATIALP